MARVTGIDHLVVSVGDFDRSKSFYAPLMEFIADNRIHAVSIKTYTPAEWARDRKLNGF